MPKEIDIQSKTIFFSTAARIFYKISGLIIVALAAKGLGPKELGLYYFIIAILSILAVIARFNVSPVIIRKLSRQSAISIQYISNILGFQSLTLLLSFGISLVLGVSLQLNIKIIMLCFFCLGLENLYIVLSSLFVAHEKVNYNISIGVCSKALLIILILIYLRKITLLNFVYIQLATNLFLFGLALIITVIKFGITIPNFDYRKWKPLIKECSPFLMIEILTILLLKMDSLALGLFSTLQAVGYFGVILAIKKGFELFPEGLQLVLLPKMSKLFGEKEQLQLLYRKYQNMYLIGGILLVVSIFPFAKILILKIFGGEFGPTIFSFRLILVTVPIMFLCAINKMLFTAVNKEKQYLSFIKNMVIAKLILILTIVPRYGYLGAVSILILLDIAELCYTQFWAMRI